MVLMCANHFTIFSVIKGLRKQSLGEYAACHTLDANNLMKFTSVTS